ncbi:class I SAM-dependent methyltransferase [bacterium]|nr:class I SAM-dependent methyltransferase [candidate division CSSED10-310 bacterium]
MTKRRKKNIAPGIQAAHNRVADNYGIVGIDGQIPLKGYNAWHFRRNVINNISFIVENYYKGGLFLEAGCGNGQISQILVTVGVKKIIGVDFSFDMLRTALKRAGKNHYRERFCALKADLANTSMFKTECFDISFLFGVIEHLDNPDLVIHNLITAIRPGGHVIIGVPRKFSLSYFTYMLSGQSPSRWGRPQRFFDRFRYSEKLRYYRFFRPADIERIIQGITMKCSLIKKIPFARCHMDGIFGKLLHVLGNNPKTGYRLLNLIEKIMKFLRFIPAGEFWILRRKS